MTGSELRARRKELGLTQEQLAEYWGVPQPTISNWETGTWPIQHAKILDDALKYLERLKQKPLWDALTEAVHK